MQAIYGYPDWFATVDGAANGAMREKSSRIARFPADGGVMTADWNDFNGLARTRIRWARHARMRLFGR
jgi:hypothetical protein